MSTTTPEPMPERRARRRRSDGERSRAAILREAARLATIEGIDGLSIGRLADAVGMSKSGLFAHFGSKEELQLATIEAANAVFAEQVIDPAAGAASGLERLQQLAEGFLRHVEDGVFPGGCFFASVSAEMDTHPGPVRDLTEQVVDGWFDQLETAVRQAQAEGTINPAEDAAQLVFEVHSFLLLANAQFVASGQHLPIERARRAFDKRVALAAP